MLTIRGGRGREGGREGRRGGGEGGREEGREGRGGEGGEEGREGGGGGRIHYACMHLKVIVNIPNELRLCDLRIKKLKKFIITHTHYL